MATPVRLLGHGTTNIVAIISVPIANHDATGHQSADFAQTVAEGQTPLGILDSKELIE